jgi:imidazolonepropionase-like amidohydrolase
MANNSNVLSPSQAEKAIRVGADMINNFGNAYRAGVRIAFGTDSGVSRHGTNAREAVLMHEAGMPEMDVLISATVNAADLIDMTDHLGTLEVGKRADIIAMSQSPLRDIEALLNVGFVMKDGDVVKNELD